MEKNKGHYLGTEINEKWWKLYKKNNFFMRGNGNYWYDETGFYFARYWPKEPMFIPFEKVVDIKLKKWHAGRWAMGNLIVAIVWMEDDLKLSSGFIVSRHKEDASRLRNMLADRIRT